MNIEINPSIELMTLVLVVSIFVIYFSYYKFIRFQGVNILILFRTSLFILFLILLLNPTLEKKKNIKKSLPWRIYFDKSLSIKYHKQPSSDSYKKGIKNFIDQINDKGIIVETFTFGSELDTLKNIAEINLDANSTSLGLVIEDIKGNYNKNLAGAVIFTDGQINQGARLGNLNYNNSIPISIVGIGDVNPMLDISIQSVDIPPICTKGEKINIDVLVSSVGEVKERINVTLFDDRKKLIGSKVIKIAGNESRESIRFQINPDKIGENNYLVKCSALSDEINIQNNKQRITTQVMKNQYNIALVTGAPSYNTNLVKNYFLEKSNNSLDHFVINENNFNNKIKKFLEKKYEVIIFDNNPVLSSARKWDSVFRVFTKKLISHKSSLFIIPGPETDIKSLDKYLKIIDLEAKIVKPKGLDNLEWEFLNIWDSFHSFNENNLATYNYDSYPPQNPAFQLIKMQDNNNAKIYARYLNLKEENPLLILGEKQLVRYAVWNSIDLASIHYKLSESDLKFLLESSIKKIINWLMKKNDSREFIFRTDKNSYQQGESVNLTGVQSELNEKSRIINDGIVELYHEDNYLSSKSLFYDLNTNEYKSSFWAPKPGEIVYKVKLNKGLESYEVSSGEFKVQESHIELNRIFLNYDKLLNLTKTSGGNFIGWSDNEKLINSINEVITTESYVLNFTFRHNYFYISLIIILLSLEWIYRRKIGLL